MLLFSWHDRLKSKKIIKLKPKSQSLNITPINLNNPIYATADK